MPKQKNSTDDPLFPKQPITVEVAYVVQYWDNWGFIGDQYVPPDNREYRIVSGPHSDYLKAVLEIMELSKHTETAKYDIMMSTITGTVQGFDVDSGEI